MIDLLASPFSLTGSSAVAGTAQLVERWRAAFSRSVRSIERASLLS